jgi:hypothetical protein
MCRTPREANVQRDPIRASLGCAPVAEIALRAVFELEKIGERLQVEVEQARDVTALAQTSLQQAVERNLAA